MTYTVKQLADLAGVSVRTLHHYDDIGLLTPPVIAANGYRYYDERSALRLQSILFYRELEFPLEAIKAALDRPDFDALNALQQQRTALEAKRGRLDRLITTIDQTISHLRGEMQMTTKQMFAGLTPEQENRYADEAAQRWGENSVRASQQRYQRYTAEEKARIKAEGEAVYREFVALLDERPDAPAVRSAVAKWRKHLEYFWVPDDAQCVALATGYRDDPAFRKTFDTYDPRLAPFMAAAVAAYVAQRNAAN